MRQFTKIAQTLPSASDAFRFQIETKLNALKERYADSRESLIPTITSDDFASRADLADKKSKIGCTFGSELGKKAGSFNVENIIYCKLFEIAKGGIERLQVQEAWVNALKKFYGSADQLGTLFQGAENESILASKYGPIINDISKLLEQASDIAKQSRLRVDISRGIKESDETEVGKTSDRTIRDARSIPGYILLALVPKELQKDFVVDLLDAYLKTSPEQTKTTTTHLARFIVLEDHFPYTWKTPKGSSIQPVRSQEQISDVFDYDRELRLVWDTPEAKETYLPDYISGDVREDGKPVTQTKVVEKNGEAFTVEYPVLTLSKSPAYTSDRAALKNELTGYEQVAQLSFTERFIINQAEEKAAESKQPIHKHFLPLIREKLGPLLEEYSNKEGETKKRASLAGKLAFRLLYSRENLRKDLAELLEIAKKLKAAERGSAEQKALSNTLVENCKKNFVAEWPAGVTELGLTNELLVVYSALSRNPESVTGEMPTSTADPRIYNKGIYPTSAKFATVSTNHDGKEFKVKIPTEQNPFYMPKLWPTGKMKGRAQWPGATIPSVRPISKKSTGLGNMLTEWGRIPWGTLSLEAKRTYLQQMKDQLAQTEDDSLEMRLTNDIAIIEKALFADELVSYVKLNLAFNLDDIKSPSIVSKVENAPPLFYVKNEQGIPKPVTINMLLSEDDRKRVASWLGTDQESIDVITKEDQNFGMLRHPSDFIGKVLKEELEKSSKEASLFGFTRTGQAELLTKEDQEALEEGEEIFFDLDGNRYDSEKELVETLSKSIDAFSIEDKVRLANEFAKRIGSLIKQDVEFERTLEALMQAVHNTKIEQEKPKEVPPQESIPEKTEVIPSDQDKFELPPIQFPAKKPKELEEEELPLAASLKKREVKGFTK